MCFPIMTVKMSVDRLLEFVDAQMESITHKMKVTRSFHEIELKARMCGHIQLNQVGLHQM
jgi:hypothetical protein